MTVRILIADDQALVRAGFKMILDAEDDLDVVGEASDGAEAVELARRLRPDVVLMDIRMPQLDGIEHAAYRVVQEAITNAIKYAGAAPTEVRVSYGVQDVELHVCDRGPAGVAAARVGGGGHGLVGMRERVRIFGGELHTGRRAGGGFEVRARIPLDGRAEHA